MNYSSNKNDSKKKLTLHHKPFIIWFTGLSSSGKTTAANGIKLFLVSNGYQVILLDGDDVRKGLCSDLGYDTKDRHENNRRVAEIAKLLYQQGFNVICSLISPFWSDRKYARDLFPKGRFIEIYIECDLITAQERDDKGLYMKAINNEINEFAGITSIYEVPIDPEIIVNSKLQTPDYIIGFIIDYFKKNQFILD